MPGWTIDVALIALLGLITWCVYAEGLWGASLMFVNVMLAGLIAFDFYEPLADAMDRSIGLLANYSDFLALVILFALVFSLIRFVTDSIAPTLVRFPGWTEQAGRTVFAFATAWFTVGMLLCMAQTASIHKQFLGYQWQRHSLGGIDRFWLGYVQRTTERILDKDPPQLFDENSDFIIRYHNHRPFGQPDPQLKGQG